MKNMFKFLKPYWYFALGAPLAMLLEVSMDLQQPLFMRDIVDVGINNGDMAYVKDTLITMLIIALVGYVGGILCSYFAGVAAVHAGTDLRDALYEKTMSLSFSKIDELESGRLITRLTNDVMQVQRTMLMMMKIAVRAPLLAVGSLVMTYVLSPDLFKILLVIIPLLLAVIYLVNKLGRPLFITVQSRLDTLNTVFQENLAGIRVIKAFVRHDFEHKRFEESAKDYKDISIKVSRIMSLLSPISMLLVNLGVIITLLIGGYSVIAGNMAVGTVMAFINYLMQLLMALMLSANLMMMFTRASASADRINEILDIDEAQEVTELQSTWTSFEDNITFDNVSFSYSEHTGPVLKNINFTAKKGQTVAIIGSTGSGKSSLVQLIPRLYEVTKGSITVDGIDIKAINPKELRKRIGMVLQETVLFAGTIKENIGYGYQEATSEDIETQASIVEAHGFISGFTKQYDTELGQRGVNISGGQKQRIAIARGLIRKPSILILDDSTSAVDVITEQHIRVALKERAKDLLVFIVAQRISSVVDADIILVMDHGEIVGQGNHEDLLKSNVVYREIYESQLGKVGDKHVG